MKADTAHSFAGITTISLNSSTTPLPPNERNAQHAYLIFVLSFQQSISQPLNTGSKRKAN
jgi:hypothetical protein